MSFDYPVTLDVTGRRCVVLGGGPHAAAKAGDLALAGAVVEVVTPSPGRELRALVDGGEVVLTVRSHRSEDLAGAFVVVATGEDPLDHAPLRRDAEEAGALLNAMDDVANCHFAFPSLLRRGDLTVAISTAGRAPAVAKRLRRQLEEQVRDAHGHLVGVAAAARAAALPRTVPFAEWARRWAVALDDLDGLLALLERGETEEVERRLLVALTDDAAEIEATGPSVLPPGGPA